MLSLCTDSAPNMVRSVQLLGVDRVPCVAHAIHNMVQHVLVNSPELLDNIEKIKAIVTYFKQNTTAKCKLDERRKNECEKIRALTLSVSTRWNSEYFMIERFFEQRSELAAVIVTHKNCPPMVDKACLTWIPEVLLLLAELEKLTTKVSSGKVTSSIVFPYVNVLYGVWNNLKLKTDVAIRFRRDLITAAKDRLDKFEKVPVLRMATILDPRFKTSLFQNKLNCPPGITSIINELNKCLTPETAHSMDVDDKIAPKTTDSFLSMIQERTASVPRNNQCF